MSTSKRHGKLLYGKFVQRRYSRIECYICDKRVLDGEYYITFITSRRSPDYNAHHSCLQLLQQSLEDNKDVFEAAWEKEHKIISERKNLHKDKLKKVREKRNFKKSIIKEALKQANLKVTDLSLRNPNDNGLEGEGNSVSIHVKSCMTPFVLCKFNGQDLFIISPSTKDHWGNKITSYGTRGFDRTPCNYQFTKISLADTRAIGLAAQAILDYSIIDLTPFFRKKK